MPSICEKKISAEVRLIHAKQIPLYNFIVLRKNNRHVWRLNKSSKSMDFPKLKIEGLKLDCPYGSTNNLVDVSKKWGPRSRKEKLVHEADHVG